MSTIDTIARIKRLSKERDYCLAMLEMWAKVEQQGVDPEAVASFGFDEKLLSGKDRDRHKRVSTLSPFVRRLPTGGYVLLFYNYVRLKDGTVHPLDPMVQAPRQDEIDL